MAHFRCGDGTAEFRREDGASASKRKQPGDSNRGETVLLRNRRGWFWFGKGAMAPAVGGVGGGVEGGCQGWGGGL